jgi:CHAT domain-containing protein
MGSPEIAVHIAEFVARLAEAPSESARLELLERETGLHQPETVQGLYAEVLQLAYRDTDAAERLAHAAQWLADRLGDRVSRAAGLRCAGHMHFARARYQPAFDAYAEALRLLEEEGPACELEVGRTLATGLQVLIYLGRYDEAFEWAARAREIYARRHDELRLARLTSNMGNILYRQDRHQEAIALYRQACAQLQRIGEPRDIAAVLSNMAVCYTSLSDFPAALEAYRQTREHCVRHGLDLLTAAADYNIAYLYYLRGDYPRAMDLYQETRVHCQKSGDAYHDALCDLDESEMYLELNLSEEGARLAERAARKFDGLGMGYEHAKAVANSAVAASQRGNAASTMRLLRRARRLFLLERNQAWPAVIDLYLALVYQQMGRMKEAWRYSSQAYEFLRGSLLPAKAALCELLQAQLLREEGEFSRARALCLRARDRLQAPESPAMLFYAYTVLGQVEEEDGDPEAAWRAYQEARCQSENLLSRIRSEQMQVSFLKDKLAVYERLVWLCLERGSSPELLAEAFQYIEEAKSRRLADTIAYPVQREAGPAEAGTPAARIRNLRRELDWHYRQMELAALRTEPAGARRIEHLRRQARERETELVQRMLHLRTTHRTQAVFMGEGTVALEQILSAIPPDAALLQYFQLRGTICVCILSGGRLEIVPLAKTAAVREALRLLQFQMTRFRLGGNYLNTFGQTWKAAAEGHLRELYQKIFAPLRRRLDCSHLIVAPQGFLHYLPFHALHDGSGFLMDSYTMSYTPSASVYALCCAREEAFEDRAVVLGVPDVRAPGIETEARTVASLLPDARLFLGEAATRQVLREQGHASRFVHIATHGIFRSDNPMFSSIRLGDGHLSLFDLYELPLSADLVTLSGCSTGLNVVVGGDELFGLMRGLLSAGAHSILVSLWDVYDRSTAEFMAAFYRNLKDHGDKARAARDAMLAVRDQYSHPFYWAPFVIVGKYLDRRCAGKNPRALY